MTIETVYIDMETDLIFKVLSGEASATEQQQVEHWKNSHVKNASEFDALQMYWKKNNQLQEKESETGFDRGLRELKEEITRRIKIQRRRKQILWTVVIVMFGSSLLFLFDHLVRNAYEKELLKFDEVKIAQVIAALEKKYHVTINIPASLKECVFSGSTYNTSLQSSLEWIAGSMGWQVIQSGDSIYKMEGEQTTVTYITKMEMDELCKNHHCVETFFRKLISLASLNMMRRITEMLEENGTERYNNFVRDCNQLLQRISLGDLASFLGITQVSLSRIRAKK